MIWQALLYRSKESLEQFLKLPGVKPVLGDRLVEFTVPHESGSKSFYAALLSAVGFANDYHGVKRCPNCRIIVDPSKGSGPGLLSLQVATRNRVGVGMGSELVLSYGASYDLDVDIGEQDDQGASKRFRGALDALFGAAAAGGKGGKC